MMSAAFNLAVIVNVLFQGSLGRAHCCGIRFLALRTITKSVPGLSESKG
jgi:hypothetical protein